MTDELAWMPGYEMAAAIKQGSLSPVEAVDAVLAQLDKVEPSINAFVTVVAEEARAEAKAAAERLTKTDPDELGPLFGVPVSVKDLCDTAGVRTTYGSEAYADHVPDRDAIAWSRMKAAGAILIGKTTTPEFGMLGVTDSVLTGVTNNPWALTHTSGGSSGGAAASVAAGVGPFAWGSDGGGSIRIPAACCGVVGLKASMGRIPQDTMWESVSAVGPLTRNVRDAALLMDITSGPHRCDPYSLPRSPSSFVDATIGAQVQGLHIAYTPDFGTARVDPEVRAIVETAVAVLDAGGASVVHEVIGLPDPIEYFEEYWSPEFAASIDLLSEMTTPDGLSVASRLHPAMREIAAYGHRLSAVRHFHTAHVTRGEILAGFNRAFDSYDVIVTPTMPVTAFRHPGPAGGNLTVDGMEVSRPPFDFHRLTEPASHAGLPSITVPCGFSAEGLPVGLQIVGPQHADSLVIRVASAFESMTSWSARRSAVG